MITGHLLLFFVSIAITWFFGGLLVEAVHRVATKFNQNGFTTAFFVLGFLTSISEISVMINSSLSGTPQISAGNIAGASFVILLCIIPLLAIVGKGIHLKNTLNEGQLCVALLAISLPVLFLLDGSVTSNEGVVCLLAYSVLLYSIHKVSSATTAEIVANVEEELLHKKTAHFFDFIKILVAGIIIFTAGNILVGEVVFFAQLFQIPSSVIGLVILSLGTNVPEITIALRAIGKGKTDIAFGDYIGSATTNTLIFAVLAMWNGTFNVVAAEFKLTALLMIVGFVFFFKFAKSKTMISRREGIALISVYVLFILAQVVTLISKISY